MNESKLRSEPDGVERCWWHGGHTDYIAYHDNEWGQPVACDTQLFEKICLEGFQAGLSWLTILRKREHFRKAFRQFDFHKVAKFTEKDVERLLQDTGIVRHRGKIKSTINNAQRALEMEQEFGSLAAYFWQHEPCRKSRPKKIDAATLSTLTKTAESTALSRDLKKRGWSFVGPTTMNAFMQAIGMVNDHLTGCVCRPKIEAARKAFVRPN